MEKLATASLAKEFQRRNGLDDETMEWLLATQILYHQRGQRLSLDRIYNSEVGDQQDQDPQEKPDAKRSRLQEVVESAFDLAAKDLVSNGKAVDLEEARAMLAEAV